MTVWAMRAAEMTRAARDQLFGQKGAKTKQPAVTKKENATVSRTKTEPVLRPIRSGTSDQRALVDHQARIRNVVNSQTKGHHRR
jgi:hypothetical protein